MPPPANTDELVQRLRRSGLVPGTELDSFLSGVSPDITPRDILDRMVADRILTPFQANRLAVGKYKGFLLGGYIILDKIGTGGMGQVFLAEHANMRRLVAIKVMPAGIVADDAVARERFMREARAAAVLNHPNIVRVFDLNREGGLPYLVMEYIDGLSLQTLVTQAGPVAPGVAAGYGRHVALGLQHAHEKGLVHRDIKPGNVLVDREGTARILDLGLVRNIEDIDTKLTNQLGGQSILGTADYLAPEQAVDSSKVDIRADIYSLGCTLYFMIAGHPLFPEGRTAQKLMWQQWKEPTPIRELKPEVPQGLAAVVHKAIAKKADDRYQKPQELADALAEFVSGNPAPDPSLIPNPPTRRWSGRGTDLQPSQRPRLYSTGPASGGGGGPSSSGAIYSSSAPEPKPVARIPDQVWGQQKLPSVTDNTPRVGASSSQARPAPATPSPPRVAPNLVPPRVKHLPGSDEVPLGISQEPLETPAHAEANSASEKPKSRLLLALGLLIVVLATTGVALFFASQ